MIARLGEAVKKEVMGSASFENIVWWHDLNVEISEDRRWANRPLTVILF